MRKTFFLALLLTAFTTGPLRGQPGSAQPGDFQNRVRQIINSANPDTSAAALTKFGLNFPGGTANQLAAAIEKAMGKPLNVIVPDEFANAKLPPIKVTAVTAPQLFQTLLEGSYKYGPRPGMPGNSEIQSSYGFKAIDGPRTDETIWTFYIYKNLNGELPEFNIDFPGGKPKDLVAAIQKASGHPLNAIVPDEFADMKLPPLKMNGVDVGQLFHALELASAKTETYVTASPYFGGPQQNYQQRVTSYGFKTDGKITEDAIWYFHVDKPPLAPEIPPQKISRFYALAPYLDRGLKVDDITTAVETAWKMSGETSPPSISFHKDTKLLIAVGAPDKLQTIDAVLQALKPEMPKPQTSLPPAEKKPDPAKTPE